MNSRSDTCLPMASCAPPSVKMSVWFSPRGQPSVQPLRTLTVNSISKLVSTPVQFDDQPIALRRPAPGTGEHTDEILAEAGLAPAEIARLRGLGAIR